YYRKHCGEISYSRDEPHWLSFFGLVADNIIADLRPQRVLDAGCAHGFLVESLRDRGVEAVGFDISEFAISQVPDKYREFVRIGSLLDPIEGKYDLITCVEVLEHLPPQDARTAIRHLTNAADRVLLSTTPYDFAEPTHLNVRRPEYWARLFAEVGFHRDLTIDASFLSPWAVVFTPLELGGPEVVERLEREIWSLKEERNALRVANASVEAGHPQETVDRLNSTIADLRQQVLALTDAAIGAERSAGTARAEASELLTQLQGANNQLEVVGGVGEELRDLKSGRAMRLATVMSRTATRLRKLSTPG
ncbi:MAG: methyltransferase domain-containing protein, partial [Acidimicrobiales bacterium]